MFSSMILYLCFIAAGVLTGARVLKPDGDYRWIGGLQTAALLLLIFTMGARIGADERVLAAIGTLGVKALIITALSAAGSVAAVFAARKLMRLDHRGIRMTRKSEDEKCIADRLCDGDSNVKKLCAAEEFSEGSAFDGADGQTKAIEKKENMCGSESACGGEIG